MWEQSWSSLKHCLDKDDGFWDRCCSGCRCSMEMNNSCCRHRNNGHCTTTTVFIKGKMQPVYEAQDQNWQALNTDASPFRWWVHWLVASCSFFGLCPTGPQGSRPGHQTYFSQVWLQDAQVSVIPVKWCSLKRSDSSGSFAGPLPWDLRPDQTTQLPGSLGPGLGSLPENSGLLPSGWKWALVNWKCRHRTKCPSSTYTDTPQGLKSQGLKLPSDKNAVIRI